MLKDLMLMKPSKHTLYFCGDKGVFVQDWMMLMKSKSIDNIFVVIIQYFCDDIAGTKQTCTANTAPYEGMGTATGELRAMC